MDNFQNIPEVILKLLTFLLSQADRAPAYEPPKLIQVLFLVRLKLWLMCSWNTARSTSLNKTQTININYLVLSTRV